jgi:hypothetical protein
MVLLAALWRQKKSMAMGRWQAALALVLLATFVAGSGGSSGASTTSTTIQINAVNPSDAAQIKPGRRFGRYPSPRCLLFSTNSGLSRVVRRPIEIIRLIRT